MPIETDTSRVSVRILEKEYQFACPPEEKPALIAAADVLHERMKRIRDTGKVVGVDRVAVMAALNLADELLKVQGEDTALRLSVDDHLKTMRDRLDTALGSTKQLNL